MSGAEFFCRAHLGVPIKRPRPYAASGNTAAGRCPPPITAIPPDFIRSWYNSLRHRLSGQAECLSLLHRFGLFSSLRAFQGFEHFAG